MATAFRNQLASCVVLVSMFLTAGCSSQQDVAVHQRSTDEQPSMAEVNSPPEFAQPGRSQVLSQPAASFAAAPQKEALADPPNMLRAAPMASFAAEEPAAHLSHLPAGTQRDSRQGYATVRVFYATDRQRAQLSLNDFHVQGQKQTFLALCYTAGILVVLALVGWILKRFRTSAVCALGGAIAGCLAVACVVFGRTTIEKHGVVYSGDRGVLTRGICDVTVPDTHRRGLVERPSLLKFEFREDQQQHIVLTSAIELSDDDFGRRLTQTLEQAPARDLLVFIHGFNVDFEEAVQRTAQIAIDLPFEGVPICYSWPSQGSLLGYSVDENNSEWTIPHLEKFLLELAQDSGAKSINVIAHSMGNRVMTAAMQQISRGLAADAPVPFDRIVLAAPDVDADRFRRDFAPALLTVGKQVTLYASSDDQALIASKQVHGYPRAGESGANIVVVPGIETIDVSGIDLSLLGHSYYGDSESILRDLFGVVRARLPAPQRQSLVSRQSGQLVYWQLAQLPGMTGRSDSNQLR